MTDDRTVTFAPTDEGEAPAAILTVDAQPARRLANRYELLQQLGKGGMGIVHEARDVVLRRSVAVKMIHTQHSINAAKIQRFRREAELTSQLQHPNIIPLYDLLQDAQGTWFFVMKKVEGNTLRWILDGITAGDRYLQRIWDHHRLLSVFHTVCQAVGYAHQRNVLHRDIKTENVMIGPLGEVYVMDWGIARIVDQLQLEHSAAPEVNDHTQTQNGSIVGTISYMSPEQARGALEQIQPPSDVWSLGILLARILIHGVLHIPSAEHARSEARPAQIASELLHTLRASASVISPDVISLCERALQIPPSERFPDAAVMAEAVQKVLSGEARRRRAAAEIDAGRKELGAFKDLLFEEQRLIEACEQLSGKVVKWTPLSDPVKVALREKEQQLDAVRTDQAQRFSGAVAAGERALSHDPDSRGAKGLLSEVFWHAYERAERSRDHLNRTLYASRLRALAVPTYCRLLDGDGMLTLSTEPVSADVLCQRFDQSGLVWSLEEPVWLGRTPLRSVPMAPGSYLLTLRAPGFADVRYPVYIHRATHWQGEDVRLLRPAQIPDGMVYVPGGPAMFGHEKAKSTRYWSAHRKTQPGFLLARFTVTAAEYVAFLNGIPRDEALLRRPREGSGRTEEPIWFWPAPAPGKPFTIPTIDNQGSRWQPQWPVCGVSWEDASAYARWLSQETGLPYRLPSEHEWEKAARGVDGRRYVWGDKFDYSLCKLNYSRPERLQIEPVGTFPTDCSVYGVRDLIGSVREWASNPPPRHTPDSYRTIRGGAWSTTSVVAVAYNRFHLEARDAYSYIGVRLALDIPPEE